MKKLFLATALCAFVGDVFAGNDAKDSQLDTLVVTTQPVMHCSKCENKIKSNIRFVKGTKSIETSVPDQKVTIIYNNKKSSLEDFKKEFKRKKLEQERKVAKELLEKSREFDKLRREKKFNTDAISSSDFIEDEPRKEMKRVYENEYVESGIPFYRSKEIIELSNNQNVSLELYISDELYNRYKNAYGVPKESDILITSVGSIGNIYQVQKNDKFYFKDGNLTWIKSSKNKILSNYLVCWLQSDIGKSTLLSSTIGTSQSALTIENLKRIKILLPNESSLLKFSNIFSSINKEIINLTISKQNLVKQRDLLLPRLMSGKLEVE